MRKKTVLVAAIVSILILAVGVCGCGGGSSKSTGTTPVSTGSQDAPQLGLNFIRFYWDEGRGTGQEGKGAPYYQPEAIFKDFSELGVQSFRQSTKADLMWDTVEPQDNQWNWGAVDSVIENKDFEPIVTLFSLQYASPNPPWATSSDKFQKTLGPEAKNYLEKVADRYGPYVKYWELGNEMDHWRAADPGGTPTGGQDGNKQRRPDGLGGGSQQPGGGQGGGQGNQRPGGKGGKNQRAPGQNPGARQGQKRPAAWPEDGFSPREQGVFLAQAAKVIREHDPDAVIVLPGMGGLADYNLNTWLDGVIEGGGKDFFDVVNYHYYSSWERYGPLRSNLTEFMKQHGIESKPVWCTETGATASPTLTIRTNYPNSAESQAADIFRRIVQAYGYGDSLVNWHTYIGSGDTPNNAWRLYGIRTDSGEAMASYHAFKLLAHELVPFAKVETISSKPGGENSYKITTKSEAVRYVVWGSGEYTVPAGVSQTTSVIPQADGSYNWQPVQAGQKIALSGNPMLLK